MNNKKIQSAKKILLFLFLVSFKSLLSQSIPEIKTVASFIYVKDSLGKMLPNGTCFFVGINSPKDSSRFFPYLITAKHVLQKNNSKGFYKEVFIRMNTIDSSSRFTWLPINLSGPDMNVFFHSDPAVDIAVIPYVPPKNDYLFRYLDETFLFDRRRFKSLPIVEGAETIFTGLFTPYTGEKKIYPIVRFGKISLLTNEKIDWIGVKREMILIESSSFGGNSGSPVYFQVVHPNGYKQLILGGVLSGTYRDLAEIQVLKTSNTSGVPVALYNNGISGITPAYLLWEIIHSKELTKIRSE